MKKTYAAVVILIVISVGGFFAYGHFQKSQYKSSLTPSVKMASIRVSNAAAVELHPSSITYREVIERLEVDVSEIDKKVVDIQSMSTDDNSAISNRVISYLQGCQDLSRGLIAKNRKEIALNVQSQAVKDAVKDLPDEAGLGLHYAVGRMSKAIESSQEAKSDLVKAAAEVTASATRLKDFRAKLNPDFEDVALIKIKLLDDLAAKSKADVEVLSKVKKS